MLWLWTLACAPDTGPPPCTADEGGLVSLPADDGAHVDDQEHWTWSGHVQDDQGAWYGYRVSFDASWDDGVRRLAVTTHITDEDGESYHYDSADGDAGALDTVDGFSLALDPARADGGGGLDVLTLSAGPYTLTLQLEEAKPPVLHHGDGHTTYDVGGEAWYYSRTRMLTTGTLARGSESHEVTGRSWFDHRWGSLAASDQIGWDWFTLSLDDGFEYMLFQVRADDATGLTAGSWVDPGCGVVDVAAQAVAITPLDSWTSPWSGCTYPQGWAVQILNELYTLTPLLTDQESGGGGDASAWHGAATVVGPITGRATVGLTGYCD